MKITTSCGRSTRCQSCRSSSADGRWCASTGPCRAATSVAPSRSPGYASCGRRSTPSPGCGRPPRTACPRIGPTPGVGDSAMGPSCRMPRSTPSSARSRPGPPGLLAAGLRQLGGRPVQATTCGWRAGSARRAVRPVRPGDPRQRGDGPAGVRRRDPTNRDDEPVRQRSPVPRLAETVRPPRTGYGPRDWARPSGIRSASIPTGCSARTTGCPACTRKGRPTA
jgi:hypothetical protein